MNLFTKNTFRNFALSMLSAAALSACGGAGSCTNCSTPTPTPTPSPGTLSLSIAAPSQYPAGVAVTAYLTMTNTSSVNGNNLVYTIPSDTNYTGVTITANPTGAGEDCANIAAGASCTFTASIPAGSKPGSFTVLATPNSTASAKTTQSSKSLQADSISVTANLGLVDVPNTQNQYYILPNDQTITANANGSTTVMISVWVKQASEGLSSLRLVDETGAALTYTTVGTPSYVLNSVNTYQVTIPAGKTLQHIQALSNVCETLNNGDNNYTACSNDADVNLAGQGHGILSVQPTQFNLSESYESQVITLTNIGTGNVGSITYPTFSSPFSVVTNNCSSVTTLTPGQSCTMTIKYTAGSTPGQITPVFGYDDDNNAATEPKNTAIIIGYAAATDPGPTPGPTAPYSILSVTPTSASLTGENPRKVFTITNTPGGSTSGVTIAGGWTLPTLSSPLEFESTNCYVTGGAVGLGAPVPMVTKALAVGASCTYTIKYSSAAEAGSASLAFTYNNGVTAGQVTNVAVDWVLYPIDWRNVGESGFSAGDASSVSFAFDPISNKPYVGYADGANGYKATVMYYNGLSWESLGSPGFSAGSVNYVSLAFNPLTNQLYVAYKDELNGSKSTVMYYNGTAWNAIGNVGFSDGPVNYTSIVFNPANNQPYVSFQNCDNSNTAAVMRYNGSSWQYVGESGFSEALASSVGMAFNPANNQPYVSFQDSSKSNKATLMYYNGSSWGYVGESGFSAGFASSISLAFNPSTNQPYVGYVDDVNSYKTTVMYYDGVNWQSVGNPGFSTNMAISMSLAFNPSTNHPCAAFASGSAPPFYANVMCYDGIVWQSIGSSNFSAGTANSLGLLFDSSTNQPYVAYQDATNANKATVMYYPSL